MDRTTIQHDLQLMSEEHHRLADVINELRSWIHDVSELGVPHFGELADRLKPLFEQLGRHFRHEEELGYLKDALARAPHLAGEAGILVDEHTALLGELESLMSRLHETEPPFESWQKACSELDGVLAELDQHERREQVILDKAFSTGSQSERPPAK